MQRVSSVARVSLLGWQRSGRRDRAGEAERVEERKSEERQRRDQGEKEIGEKEKVERALQ